MRSLLIAAALGLAVQVRAAPDQSPAPAGGARQSVQEESGQLKSTPWANTGGDAATARGAPRQPREVEAIGAVGVVVIGAGLLLLAQRRRVRRFSNPGGTEPPHDEGRRTP